MTQWMKTLVGCLCILTILLHLIPQGRYLGYVRFYAGLLFFLTAIRPLFQLLFGEGELERLLKLEFLRTEYYEETTALQGMAELKNEAILTAYRTELERQVRDILSGCGLEPVQIELIYEETESYQLTDIFLTVNEDAAGSKATQARAELADIFALNEEKIHMNGTGGG
jgi:hypothetical protein